MSLYGALFGGVSGLQAQSAKIGVVSDNIANVNTVGYKEAEALFETLVVNSSSNVSYQTGGVRGTSRQNIDKQGLLISTDAPTDVALSGDGFFTVNGQIDGSGNPLYTRAGSFRQDSNGNFVNAAGFYLQGWRLDEDGRLPGEPGNANTTPFSNLDSLTTVNVEVATGVAVATTEMSLGINLNADETIFPGQAGNITMDSTSSVNFNINAQDIIVPDEYGLATTNSIVRGDQIRVDTGNGFSYDYEYGGFTIGRDVSTAGGATNAGDSLTDNTTVLGLANPNLEFDGVDSFIINIPNHGLLTNDVITIQNVPAAGFGATPQSEFQGNLPVERVNANQVRFRVTTAHGQPAGAVPGGAFGGTETVTTRQFTGNIFDASSGSQIFLGDTGTTDIIPAGLAFTIETPTVGVSTFTYVASSPNTQVGQFNNLNSLAQAINEVVGLAARVVGGRLVAGAEDASESVTFANGNSVGDDDERGLDWVGELGLSNLTAGTRRFSNLNGLATIVNSDQGVTAVVNNPLTEATLDIRVDDPRDTIQFSDINDIVGDVTPFDFPAVVGNIDVGDGALVAAGDPIPVRVTDATIATSLNVGDSLVISNIPAALQAQLVGGGVPASFFNTAANISFTVTEVNAGDYVFEIPTQFLPGGLAASFTVDGTGTETISIFGETNQGSLLSELGLTASLNGAAYDPSQPTVGDTGVLGPRYDASGAVGQNMASGDIEAQFSRSVRIFDSLGAGHDIRFSYIKIDENEWALEAHVVPETDVATVLPNGQIITGTIQFNGDGTLRSVSTSLAAPINVNWTNGASQSTISLDLGTAGSIAGTAGAVNIGDTDGLSQFAGDYSVNFADQNGAPVGELVSVTIDAQGFVIASYDNGETANLYKLPIADFSNPNGLRTISGNVYTETRDSGAVVLREAGENSAGTIVSASLEQSNVDLAEQLTDLIVAQRAYQSNTRVISTTDELLEQLNNL